MTEEDKLVNVFLDLSPNQPKNDVTRAEFRQLLTQRFERQLPEAVERIWKLPAIILREPFSDYLSLLLEARELFVMGHFYSCVAMCGIVGERLVKDAFRTFVVVEKDGKCRRPAKVAFDQLEWVEVRGIVRFLKEAKLLSPDSAKAAEDLGDLRNKYTHARGKEPQPDSLRAIRFLHTLVKGTVSMFRDFEIKDGRFVRKTVTPKGGDKV